MVDKTVTKTDSVATSTTTDGDGFKDFSADQAAARQANPHIHDDKDIERSRKEGNERAAAIEKAKEDRANEDARKRHEEDEKKAELSAKTPNPQKAQADAMADALGKPRPERLEKNFNSPRTDEHGHTEWE